MKAILFEPYRMYPYERRFLRAEIRSMGGNVRHAGDSRLVVEGISIDRAKQLTYVHEFRNGLPENIQTHQGMKEGPATRQVTSYGPHGIHEYRGKFNPQTPRSLMIQHKLSKDDQLLDPFCGSGTTIVESSLLGIPAIGVELHPLAAFISEAKLAWLTAPSSSIPTIEEIGSLSPLEFDPTTAEYLQKWFPHEHLDGIARCLSWIRSLDLDDGRVAKVLLSNLLRDHSWQDPRDLRIRRRKEVPPGMCISKAFAEAVEQHWGKRMQWNEMGIPNSAPTAQIICGSSTELVKLLDTQGITATITSPPYATALPYADTYRLSNVVLALVQAGDLGALDRSLAGSRDVTKGDREAFPGRVAALPAETARFVEQLHNIVGADSTAGFRKRAVPYALARYLCLMQDVMAALYQVESRKARNMWVIGPNRTMVAGREVPIDTPAFLREIADSVGFAGARLSPLETYARYDLHSNNSIRTEALLSFDR